MREAAPPALSQRQAGSGPRPAARAAQARFPDDAVLDSIWELHRVPRRRALEWFAARREAFRPEQPAAEDGGGHGGEGSAPSHEIPAAKPPLPARQPRAREGGEGAWAREERGGQQEDALGGQDEWSRQPREARESRDPARELDIWTPQRREAERRARAQRGAQRGGRGRQAQRGRPHGAGSADSDQGWWSA
jgi:hypothetical protein